jgi:hypothetical protein
MAKNGLNYYNISEIDIFVGDSPDKGRGVFTNQDVKAGQKILTELHSVLGPKQTSPFVCINCFDYINENTGRIINVKNSFSV